MNMVPTLGLTLRIRSTAIAMGAILLGSATAPTGLYAQQQVPLPPLVRQLTGLQTPYNQTRQTQPTDGDQQATSPRNPSDPFGVFSRTGNGSPSPAAPAAPAPAPGPGPAPATLLVLRNGQVIRGSVRSNPRGYFVDSQRLHLFFPFDRVKFVATDIRDAHHKLCETTTDHSMRNEIALGRWCLENELLPEGAEHFKSVLQFDPANREARGLLARLDQMEPVAVDSERRGNGRPAAPAAVPESLGRLSGPAVREFVHGVQPMLLSRCGAARCHGSPAGGGSVEQTPGASSFRLEFVRVSEGGNRAATARNLDAVIKLVDPRFPSRSVLLVHGLETHGGSWRAPLDGPAAYLQEARLRNWIQAIAPELNRLKQEDSSRAFIQRFARRAQPTTVPDASMAREGSTVRDPNVTPASATMDGGSAPTAAPAADRPPVAAGPGTGRNPTPRRLGLSSDPFDPSEFNGLQPQRR